MILLKEIADWKSSRNNNYLQKSEWTDEEKLIVIFFLSIVDIVLMLYFLIDI